MRMSERKGFGGFRLSATAAVVLLILIIVLITALSRCSKAARDKKSAADAEAEAAEALEGDDYTSAAGVSVTTGYANNKTYTLHWHGADFSVGINDSGLNDAIYFNPVCSEKTVGIYSECSRGMIDVLGKEDDSTTGCFLIGLPNTPLENASYRSVECYGIRWQDDKLYGPPDGTDVQMRVVDLRTGNFLGSCIAKVVYENGVYRIASLENTPDTSILHSAQRESIINQAIALAEQKTGTNFPDWQPTARHDALVEDRTEPYHSTFNEPEGHMQRWIMNYLPCKDIFAVTIPVITDGYYVVYFAPQHQIDGDRTRFDPDDPSHELAILGYEHPAEWIMIDVARDINRNE